MNAMKFFVPGLPRPGGSKKGFVNPKTKRVVVVDANDRSKDWKASVAHAAYIAGAKPIDGPIELQLTFYLPRPKSHFNAKGELRKIAPLYPITKPDATKLLRSTEDALKGLCWHDDCQVASQITQKQYAEVPGCRVIVCSMLPTSWDDL